MRTVLTLLGISVVVIIVAHATQLEHPPGVFGIVTGGLVTLAHYAGYRAGARDARDADRR